jgi:uncharacterized protein
MKDGFRVYDTHTHIGVARHTGRTCSAEHMLRDMDTFGVDRALLIPFPVVEDEESAHNEIAEAVRHWPDRFTGCACVYPFLPLQRFRDELHRCSEELGFRALKLQPQYHGLNPLASRNDFYFEAAIENRFVLVVHTGAGAPFALPSLYISPARKFPDLKIILGHAGGGIYAAEAIVAATVCPNILIELSSLMPHHVTEVLAHVPADRLMIGSDLPESLPAEIGKILTLPISDTAKQQILWDTAIGVLDNLS